MAQQKVRPRKKEAAPKKKNKKIIKYRKPLHINVGMIIFALIFVYMVFSVYTYIRRDKVQFYEVQEGSIVNNTDYTGIILREEEVKTADRSGYINYYIREGKRRRWERGSIPLMKQEISHHSWKKIQKKMSH